MYWTVFTTAAVYFLHHLFKLAILYSHLRVERKVCLKNGYHQMSLYVCGQSTCSLLKLLWLIFFLFDLEYLKTHFVFTGRCSYEFVLGFAQIYDFWNQFWWFQPGLKKFNCSLSALSHMCRFWNAFCKKIIF